ncbi:hypothetical protein M9Y10_005568 [Tritrichomonas musculus]|uniref:Uncharacterized protein n=1 Tax=Tritrichomonas musculus TaxID=1915356 RepID=A0ABR2JD35_9EUKA
MDEKKQNLIILDFLYQKYDIEYEKNMSPQSVIRKVQQYLFPSERGEDLISNQNENSYKKLCLYRNDPNESKGAIPVTWNITPGECDYSKYQFYLFRPLINVYLTIYIVYPNEQEKHRSKAYLNIIYPIKKKVILLKNYLKDKIQEYTRNKPEFKIPMKGFILRFVSDSRELMDNEYIEQWMNGREIFLIISPENSISQNFCALGRFYYIPFDQSREMLSKDNESLDYDERVGFTLRDAKKKLIEKHQNGKNFQEDKVIVLYNSIVQTDKFDRLDDLFSDNHFYQFVVIFESDIQITQVPQPFLKEAKKSYKIPIPKEGRPNIINFRIVGEPKRELTLMNSTSSHLSVLDNENSNTSSFDDDANYIPYTKPTDPSDNSREQKNYMNDPAKEELTNENNEEIVEEENNDRNNNNTDNDDNNSNTTTTTNNNDNDNNNNINVINVNDKEKENYYNEEEIKEENLLDMFCYYFNEFMKERGKETRLTPKPGYFNNLSGDEKLLIQTFKKYYDLYRHTKQ